ncbi:MAG TPA: TonB-dependent receptor, partial [Bacteroidota bacterium]|nr:TonB-dependent receptor [Bacteroidota bacterium]
MKSIIRLLTLYMLLALCFTPELLQCAIRDSSSVPERKASADTETGLRDVRVSIRAANPSLKTIFDEVESQTRFRFVYMKDDVPLSDASPTDPGDYQLGVLLQDLSRRHGLVFNRINDRIVVKRSGSGRAETVTLTGVVRDASTNEPLVFATVAVEGTQQGTTADANGRYMLQLTPGACTLRCAFVGYRTDKFAVTVEGDSQLNIALTATDVVLQDVTVFAHRMDDAGQAEVNALTLQSETIKRVTSLIPDVMRSVQMLPGVSTNNEFSSRFNVRGGNQDENLVVVNGTQVYDPFHVKEVSNASIGIFNADMIRKMDLITGGFTARYGDKMSSVLNIEYREGSHDRVKGMMSLSMMDANMLVEGPMGEQGSFIIGGRKSYFEYVMKMLDAGPYFHPSFYDIQGVFAYAPSTSDKLMLKLIHSGDDFFEDPHRQDDPFSQWVGYDRAGARYTVTQQSGDSVDNRATYYSNMAALQYTHILSSDAVLKSEVSLYDQRENEDYWTDRYYRYKAANPQTMYFYNTTQQYQHRSILEIRTLEANSSLDLQIAPSYGIKTGLSYQDIK